jgi:hypothetical protein
MLCRVSGADGALSELGATAEPSSHVLRMNTRTILPRLVIALLLRRASVVVLLTLVSIVIHEFGHFLVYRLGGCPVTVTLQSVRAAAPVDASLDGWAKAAGPALSLLAGSVCLLVARRRPSFTWATAALTNSSLRLFPLVMDITRAVKGATPFSDEGDVARAFASTAVGRLSVLAVPVALSVLLTVLAGREYPFRSHRILKVTGVYLLSLAVGIGVVILDELLR